MTGDTLVLSAAGGDFTWTFTGGPDVMLKDHAGHDVFAIDVDRLQFSDGVLRFDTDGTNGAGAAYRIYQAAFDRTPDVGGLTYWTEQAHKNMSTIEMSARFIDSDEFRHLYGSSNLPADTFVTQVYENVLHRAGEQGGVDYWVGQINHGMSKRKFLPASPTVSRTAPTWLGSSATAFGSIPKATITRP